MTRSDHTHSLTHLHLLSLTIYYLNTDSFTFSFLPNFFLFFYSIIYTTQSITLLHVCKIKISITEFYA